MALRALPDGYSDQVLGRYRLIARDDVSEALVAAGLLRGAPIEQWGSRVAAREGGRRPLSALTIEGVAFPVLVKPLRRGGVLGPILRRAARVDRAFAEILVVETLRRAGVATPPIVAARITRPFATSPTAYIDLLIPFESDALDLDTALVRERTRRGRTALLAAAGAAVRAMHGHVVHEDLNLRNLLVRADGTVAILDLGDSRIRPASKRASSANLARLYRSAVKLGHAPSTRLGTDVVRFARGYAPQDWKRIVRAAAGPYLRTLPFHRLSWRLQGREVSAPGAAARAAATAPDRRPGSRPSSGSRTG